MRSRAVVIAIIVVAGFDDLAGVGVVSGVSVVGVADGTDGPVDDGESESTDGEADEGVENGVLGFFELAGVTGGGHIINTTDDDKDNGDNAGDTDDGVKDALDNGGEFADFFAGTASSSTDF